jgi:hypothetical protein
LFFVLSDLFLYSLKPARSVSFPSSDQYPQHASMELGVDTPFSPSKNEGLEARNVATGEEQQQKM